MTKDEMITACLETRKQGYDQAADRFQAEIDALTAQLAARDELLRALVSDEHASIRDWPVNGLAGVANEEGHYSICLYCSQFSFYLGKIRQPHADDCPILLGQQLLASKETQHGAQSSS